MIYKNKEGGVVKLQNGWTTVPNPQEIILKTWTKQRAIEEAQRKAKEQVASEKPRYVFVNPYDYTRGWRETTEDAAKQDKYTVQNLGGSDEEAQKAYDETWKNSRKQLAAITTQGLLMAPMLGEFGTYGLLGGGLRIGVGITGSKAGEYVLGKGGDWADKQLNTNFLGTTGRIIGGLAMYPFGSSVGYKGALNLAEKFPRFARFGSTNRFRSDIIGNALNKSIGKTTFYNIPVYHATDYIGNGNDLRPYGPADAGLHVGTDRSPATDILKTRANKPGTIYEGVYTYTNHTKPYQLDVDPGHTNVFHFGTESQINKLKANSPIWGVNEGSYASVGKTLTEQEQNIGRQILMDDGISAIEYPNKVEGVPGNKSIALMNPNSYVFSKNRLPSPVIIDPQTAATTYHFDGRLPMSRPISEAELKGWSKQFRNQKRGQIPASEYSGLPKGERNNGRYGDIRFIRHMDAVPELTEDGFVQIAPKDNWLANFTTDQLMVPHTGYPIEGIGKNVLIINPEAFRGTTPFSLDPGDSFFVNHELKIKPKHVTFISGDPQSIQLAKERGFNIETSPKLKILAEFMEPASWEQLETMRPALEKRHYWFHGREYSKIKKDYVDELNRVLHTRFNRPSLEDYSHIESVTGVPTHTYLRTTAPWQSFFGPKVGYKQAVYDTTPQIEYDLMKQIGFYAHPMTESMEGYSPIFFRLFKGWTPIKKQGGIINRFKNLLK